MIPEKKGLRSIKGMSLRMRLKFVIPGDRSAIFLNLNLIDPAVKSISFRIGP